MSFSRTLASVGGLATLAAGWAALVAGALTPEPMLRLGPLAIGQRDLVFLGQSAVTTGMGALLLARLSSGFGALDRFFAAALQRAERRAMQAIEPGAPEPKPETLSLAGHDLTVLPDGAVLLETVLGIKRFATLADASAFVRSLPRGGDADARRHDA